MDVDWKDSLFSSKKQDWETPKSMVRDLSSVFLWDIDVCASRSNVAVKYFSQENDGLLQQWEGLCWMNPPYGREIGNWIDKAISSTLAKTVCLVPSRTDTKWFHKAAQVSTQIVFIKGRLRFEPNIKKSGAPFPSCFIVIGKLDKIQKTKLAGYGWSTQGVYNESS